MSIYKQLAAFQAGCPPIPLDASVSFNKTQFKYATLGKILSTIRPTLTKHNLGIQHIINNGTLICIVFNESGAKISSEISIPECKTAQVLGSWITYLKRYTTTSILGIVAEDDMDAPTEDAPAGRKKGKLSNEKFKKTLEWLTKGGDIKLVLDKYVLTDDQNKQITETLIQQA